MDYKNSCRDMYMVHRKKKEIFDFGGDIAAIIMVLVISLVFVILMGVALGHSLLSEYAEPDDLIYEECTFINAKLIRQYRDSRYYEIYVEEYEEPLKIYSIALKAVDRSKLDSINAGEKITVSLEEGRDNYSVLAMFHDNEAILSYDEYLRAHQKNDTLGIIVLPLMIILGVSLLGKSIYELYLYCKTPKVTIRVTEKKKKKRKS
jgi:hypothetical protein